MMDRRGTTRGADVEFHSVANVFPLLVGDEFHGLVEDIREHGLREAITLHPNGTILDGRNRYRACMMAGVEPWFAEWDGQGTPEAFVISKNLARRHLSTEERGLIAAKLATHGRGGDRSKPPNGGLTVSEAAQVLNVGKRTVERSKRVLAQAEPRVVAAVKAGEMSVSAAERKTRPLPTAPRAQRAAREASETFRNEQEKQSKSLWRTWIRASDTARKRFTEHLEQSGAGETGEAQLYALQNQWLSANDGVRKRFGKWLEAKHDLKLIQLPPARRAKP